MIVTFFFSLDYILLMAAKQIEHMTTSQALATRDKEINVIRLKKAKDAAFLQERYANVKMNAQSNPRLRVVQDAYEAHFAKQSAIKDQQIVALQRLAQYLTLNSAKVKLDLIDINTRLQNLGAT